MSLTKLSLGGNNDVIYILFPPRESLVSDIPAGDRNNEKLFFTVYGFLKPYRRRGGGVWFSIRAFLLSPLEGMSTEQ
jgi:hypothetical protein